MSVCSLGDSDETTSTQHDHDGDYRIVASPQKKRKVARLDSELDVLVKESDRRDLWTHFYVADREPAPYAESSSDISDDVDDDDDEGSYDDDDDFNCVLFGEGTCGDFVKTEGGECTKIDEEGDTMKTESSDDVKLEAHHIDVKIGNDVEEDRDYDDLERCIKMENESIGHTDDGVTISNDENVRIHVNVDKSNSLYPVVGHSSTTSTEPEAELSPVGSSRCINFFV